MAMTKAEKAVLADLQEELMLYKAFTRTPKVTPDIQPPDDGDTVKKGWVVLGKAHDVNEACTSKRNHNEWSNTHTTTQGAIPLYSTKLLALKALRNALELQFMGAVSRLDERIRKEEYESLQ